MVDRSEVWGKSARSNLVTSRSVSGSAIVSEPLKLGPSYLDSAIVCPPVSTCSRGWLSRGKHGYIYGGVRRVRGQGQQKQPPLSLLRPRRHFRCERATAAATTAATLRSVLPPPSAPSSSPSSSPSRQARTTERVAAAQQQRRQQHSGTVAQQDESAQEA